MIARSVFSSIVCVGAAIAVVPATAQPIVPADDGTGTVVTPADNRFQIDGGTRSTDGANLFHSFEEFGLETGQVADFLTTPNTENVLGRVTGGNISVIDGLLQVSGSQANLFLTNPAGIIFGTHATLNVPADFTATTATGIGFENGIWGWQNETHGSHFLGDPTGFDFATTVPGSIINFGNLSVPFGHQLGLIGGSVLQTGTLHAPGGNITIAAVPGENLVRLSSPGTLLNLEVVPSPNRQLPITHDRLPDLLTGGNIDSTNSNIISNPDGTISITGSEVRIDPRTGDAIVSGTVDASDRANAVRPYIQILGDRVAVVSGNIDASGTNGGHVFIGGNVRGSGNLPNADYTYVDRNTIIRADAVDRANVVDRANAVRPYSGLGNGGTIIIWADRLTQFYGTASARGANSGGNGGFVEISGRDRLAFNGSVDVGAASGLAGTILFDPEEGEIGESPEGEEDGDLEGEEDGDLEGEGDSEPPPPPDDGMQQPPPPDDGMQQPPPPDDGMEQPPPPDDGMQPPPPDDGMQQPPPPPGDGMQPPPPPPGDGMQPPPPPPGNGTNPPPPPPPPDDDLMQPHPGAPTIDTDSLDNLEGNVVVEATNDINVNEAIVRVESIELRAGRSVNINANLDTSGNNGNIVVRANDRAAANGMRQPGPANINQAPGTLISSGVGRIVLDIGDAGAVGGIVVGNLRSSGNVTVDANGGVIRRSDPMAVVTARSADFFTFDMGGIGMPQAPIRLELRDRSALNSETGNGGEFFEFVGVQTEETVTRSVQNDIVAEENSDRPRRERDDANNAEVNIEEGGDIEGNVDSPLEIDLDNEEVAEKPSEETTPTEVPTDTNPAANVAQVDIGEAIVNIERERTSEFESYFGRDLTTPTTTGDVRDSLAEIYRQTGHRSAVVYVRLLPGQIETIVFTESDGVSRKSLKESDDFDGRLIRKTVDIDNVEVLQAIEDFQYYLINPRVRESDNYLEYAQQLHEWIITPIEPELQAAGINTLLFSMGPHLRSIPIAALHDGDRFFVEKYSFSIIPSVNLVDTRYRTLVDTRVLAMGATTFEELAPLPAVAVELPLIANRLWQGEAYLNEEFTRNNLIAQRRQYPYPIIHLATHGEFVPGSADNSYIQLWGEERLHLNELRQLGWNQPPVELLVLSACRTAVGSPEAELGFAGFAVAAGVKTALASLWYVSDEGTLALMSQFYAHLDDTKIKAEALRQAQLSLLYGEVEIASGQLQGVDLAASESVSLPPELAETQTVSLSHPYYWAGFSAIGSPW